MIDLTKNLKLTEAVKCYRTKVINRLTEHYLFRGYAEDKPELGWVYGDLVLPLQPEMNRVGIRSNSIFRECKLGNIAEQIYVDPESVGLYTTLKDGKGNKIFDGDILQEDYPEWLYLVFWDDIQLKWSYKRIDIEVEQSYALAMSPMALRHFTVIGNSFQNPELFIKSKISSK